MKPLVRNGLRGSGQTSGRPRTLNFVEDEGFSREREGQQVEKFEREFILTMDSETFEWLKAEMATRQRCAIALMDYKHVTSDEALEAYGEHVMAGKVLAALDASSPIRVPVSK